MKNRNIIAALTPILVILMILSGCIGQEQITVTTTQTVTSCPPSITKTEACKTPQCTVTITDVYGIQGPTDRYPQVVVTGTAFGCTKVSVTINCIGNDQTKEVLDPSGCWIVLFNGTVSECDCNPPPTPIYVTVCGEDTDGNTCCTPTLKLELPCPCKAP